jgi:hypothetical protein
MDAEQSYEPIVPAKVGNRRAPARGGHDAPYTKGNFQFERVITGWLNRYPMLDLRLKK